MVFFDGIIDQITTHSGKGTVLDYWSYCYGISNDPWIVPWDGSVLWHNSEAKSKIYRFLVLLQC
jgi:hypothetical protein